MRDQEVALDDEQRIQMAEEAEKDEFWRILMPPIVGVIIVLIIFAGIRYFA